MRRLSVASLLLLSLFATPCAQAQVRRPAPPRPPAKPRAPHPMRLFFNVGSQAVSPTFSQNLTFQQYVEDGTLKLDRTLSKSVFFDGGFTVRLIGKLEAGAAISYFKDNGAANATASIPHPLYFASPRTATGTVASFQHSDTAVHVLLAWPMQLTRSLELIASGGPTIFETQQTLATGITLSLADEVYPFDTVKLPPVTTAQETEAVPGFNVGADLIWRLSTSRPKTPRSRPHTMGLGFEVRYAHGTKDFSPVGGVVSKVEAGGVQVGGGLRFRF